MHMAQTRPAFQVGDTVLYGTREAVIVNIDVTYLPPSYTVQFEDGRVRDTVEDRLVSLENSLAAHVANDALNHDSSTFHQPSKISMSSAELIYAASDGCLDSVQTLINDQGADVHARDSDGRTSLLWAALRGHTRTVDLLMRHGAEIVDHDCWGKTPLAYASRNGHTETLNALIARHGADVDLPDLDLMTPLMHAAEKGCTDTVISLITKHRANVQAVDGNGLTPMVYAAASGSRETLDALISTCDDIHARDYFTNRSSTIARERGFVMMTEDQSSQEEGASDQFSQENEDSSDQDEEGVEGNQCRICFTNKQKILFIPCGHGTCHTCYKELSRRYVLLDRPTECHACREQVRNTQRMFL